MHILRDKCFQDDPTHELCNPDEAQSAVDYFIGRRSGIELTDSVRKFIRQLNEPEASFRYLESYGDFKENREQWLQDLETMAKKEDILFGSRWNLKSALIALWQHVSIGHLLSNVFFLLVFGSYCERRMNRCNYALTYLLSGLISTFFFINHTQYVLGVYVGASSSILALMGLFAILFNFYTFKNKKVNPVSWIQVILLNLLVAIVVIPDLVVAIGESSYFQNAERSHIFGFLFGMTWGVIILFVSRSDDLIKIPACNTE